MSRPIRTSADAVVIDQGRARARNGSRSIHALADRVERRLAAESGADEATLASERPSDDLDMNDLLRRLRDLGREDLGRLKRFLRERPKLAAALAEGYDRLEREGRHATYADRGLGIPSGEGWA